MLEKSSKLKIQSHLKKLVPPKKISATQPVEKIYKGSLGHWEGEGHPVRSNRRFIKQQLWANKLL